MDSYGRKGTDEKDFTIVAEEKVVFIQIFGEEELVEHLQDHKSVCSHCISIRNERYYNGPLPKEILDSFKDILRLEFFNSEHRDGLLLGVPLPIPEIEDVKAVISFYDSIKDREDFTGITVHGWRGMNRSAAIALGLLYLVHGDEETALAKLLEIRPQARPLNRIVEFWDEVLGSNLKLHLDKMKEKWSTQQGIEEVEYLSSENIEELEPVEEIEVGLLFPKMKVVRRKKDGEQ
jgi:predicted protein tyrosine phosphatase